MNNDIFEKAFDAIDDELLAEAKSPAIRIAVRRKKIIISATAACVAAILIAIPSVKVMTDLNNSRITTSEIETVIEYETVYENASNEQTSSETKPNNEDNISQSNSGTTGTLGSGAAINDSGPSRGHNSTTITVDDLYKVQGYSLDTDGNSITPYETVYTPNAEYLYINSLPTNKFVTVYVNNHQSEIQETEVKNLAEKFFPKISDALGIVTPQYTIQNGNNGILARGIKDTYNMTIAGTAIKNTVNFYTSADKLILGQTVTVNQAQNDNDIIASLSNIKQTVCDIYCVSFDSTKIIRSYDNSSIYSVNTLAVYFYNNDGHALNQLYNCAPYSDYIELLFNNSDSDRTSATDLYNVSIRYCCYRTENSSPLEVATEVKILPLGTAEDYLKIGYVLGVVGSCAHIEPKVTAVDFSNYDYVSVEYKGNDSTDSLVLPYYVFYKNISTAENGNMIFAKTYIPAVEVEGYEEYFINQHASHNN